MKILSIFILCVFIMESCTNAHAMKRQLEDAQTQVVTDTNPILPAEVWGKIIAASNGKNRLRLVCTLFHQFARFSNWTNLLDAHSEVIYISPRDQERIGAILLDEDNVPLMTKMLSKYPEYANRLPCFALGKPISFAQSATMKSLIEAHSGRMVLPQHNGTDADLLRDSDRNKTLQETSPSGLACNIQGYLQKDCASVPGIDIKCLQGFYRAVLKGDIDSVRHDLQSQAFNQLSAIAFHGDRYKVGWAAKKLLESALQLAAAYGYNDMIELLLAQPLLQQGTHEVSSDTLNLALGNAGLAEDELLYRAHEETARLLIEHGGSGVSSLFLDQIIALDNPDLVDAMLTHPEISGLVDNEHLILATKRDNKDIIVMIAKAYVAHIQREPSSSESSASAAESPD